MFYQSFNHLFHFHGKLSVVLPIAYHVRKHLFLLLRPHQASQHFSRSGRKGGKNGSHRNQAQQPGQDTVDDQFENRIKVVINRGLQHKGKVLSR